MYVYVTTTCLCSSRYDVNLCPSHCNVIMFVRLQCCYVQKDNIKIEYVYNIIIKR
jgi:hypothetical protein